MCPRVKRSRLTISDVVIYRKSNSQIILYSYIKEGESNRYSVMNLWDGAYLWNMKEIQ